MTGCLEGLSLCGAEVARMWWLTVPLSPSCPRREVCGYPQRCPLAHPTHSLSTNWYLFHPFPPHCTGLTQGLNTSQWSLHLVLVFHPYAEPHLAAKKIFPRHKSAHVLHLLKIPRWYPFPTGLVPDPRRDFQVPCILGPSSLSRLVSCHAPGEHAMFFPPSCLCTNSFSHSEHFSHSPPQIPTHPSRPHSIIPSMKTSSMPQPESFAFSHLPVVLRLCLCCHIYNTLL